jgi:C4-dicarboxylate-specific signal transduction histidine kinase
MPTIDPRELADLEALANVGEIVGPVTHEFNNLLNTLLLQIAVLEQTAPNGLREEIAGLKQHGRAAAALIRLVQQYRRQASPEAPQGDLNEAAAAAVAAVQSGPLPPEVKVGFTPAEGLPLARAAVADLKRLLTFLLGNAAMSGCSEVAVRTELRDNRVAVVVDVTGCAPDATFLERLTSPTVSARDGAAGLELAAARSLVRRLGGNFSAEANDSGARVAVELLRA